jgi:hypothetical protein
VYAGREKIENGVKNRRAATYSTVHLIFQLNHSDTHQKLALLGQALVRRTIRIIQPAKERVSNSPFAIPHAFGAPA